MRDDFTKETLDVLAKRVGVRCSNPSCRKLTVGPRTDPGKIVNIGVGAHIAAAAEGGPRYDASLSAEQRRSLVNGIWLCQNCAKLVDNDAARYTVDALRDWKAAAEGAALQAIEGQAGAQAATVEDAAEIELIYKAKIDSERHDYVLQVVVRNLGIKPLVNFHVDLEFPARVIEKPEGLPTYVNGRSTNDTSFFRATLRGEDKAIFPGDEQTVIKLPYFLDQKVLAARGRLFEHPVRAKLYRNGLRPLAIEKPFNELQCF